MTDFRPALPHGDLEEVFPDVFFVTGTTRPVFQGTPLQFSRNMTVVREGEALTLINTVRLDEAGLAALDALGRVEHIVRIGGFHGIDDAFYRDRYEARVWALPGMEHEGGFGTDHELVPGGPTPFPGCEVFHFVTSKVPEGMLLIDRAGGVLVSCDALQNWVEADRFFDEATAERMAGLGFFAPANIGPGWRGAASPGAADFERAKALSFQHLLSAHGVPLRDDAHARLSETFAREYGV